MQSESDSATGTEMVVSSDPSTGSGPIALQGRTRLGRFVAALYRQTLVDPIEQGRLRDVMWPYGLRAIVLVGYLVFTIAALTVIFSGFVRQHSTLIVFGFGSGLGLPAEAVWPLVLFLSFGVAALMAAAQTDPCG
jgi:hypothetical protein